MKREKNTEGTAAMKPIVLPFGAPRSGTTFLHRAFLLKVKDVFVPDKFRESYAFHPCRSNRGLMGLAQLFVKQHLVFVRILRHPMSCVESFVATRKHVRIRGSLSLNDDEAVVRWLNDETRNFHHQMRYMKEAKGGWETIPWRVVQVKYESLFDPRGVRKFIKRLAKVLPESVSLKSLECHINKNFGVPTAAAIAGRLESGIDFSVLTPVQRQFFVEELRSTAAMNGYDIEKRPNDRKIILAGGSK